MSVILLDTHKKMVRKVKRRAFIIHGFGVLLTAFVFLWPCMNKIESDLIRTSYGVVRQQLVGLEFRYLLMEILRNKPMTVGQALEVADVVIDQAKTSEVPIHMVLSVMSIESEFRTDALSVAGARGLMQVMPATWSQYVDSDQLKGQVSRHSPALNVRVGIRYLGDLIKQYGDWRKALRVYGGFAVKASDNYVNAVIVRAEQYKARLGDNHGY